MNILQTIKEYHDSSGGSCGITVVQLCVKTGVSITSVKPLLKELRDQGKIKVRPGINLNLIYPITNNAK